GIVARSFVTGVNPLLLDDLTSGFNIAVNISLRPEFAGMLGFSSEETAGLLARARQSAEEHGPTAGLPSMPGPPDLSSLPNAAELAELATAWYDGYRFHPRAAPLFNPDMVLYLMMHLTGGELPRRLLDINLRTDLGKLELMVRKAGDFPRLWQLLETDGGLPVEPAETFGLERLAEPANFHSLLYYLGMLSFAPGPEPSLRIPNYVVRTLYWTEARRLAERELQLSALQPLRDALRRLLRDGEGEPFFRLLLDEVIRQASKRDLIHLNETGVKATALAFLSLSDEISVFSEWETNRGYADLVLVPAPAATWLSRAWLIELKYLKKGDAGEAARQHALEEGQGQLQRYLSDARRMAYLSRFTLHTAVALFVDAEELVWQPGPQPVPAAR
ncbi:MAG: hypothetical protein FJ125_14735, partial [Deltaproteobacteria bacterium]|nr:hypothetical protein [Deltaproteobacteria bacterium]